MLWQHKGGYKAIKKSPMGASDHDTVFLIPSYRQKLKTGKPKSRSGKVWDDDSVLNLQGCFE